MQMSWVYNYWATGSLQNQFILFRAICKAETFFFWQPFLLHEAIQQNRVVLEQRTLKHGYARINNKLHERNLFQFWWWENHSGSLKIVWVWLIFVLNLLVSKSYLFKYSPSSSCDRMWQSFELMNSYEAESVLISHNLSEGIIFIILLFQIQCWI